MPEKLPHHAATTINEMQHRLAGSKVLVGLDGFVDSILHVVDKRESATKYARMTRMKTFAQRIEAAAGQSANFEFVTKMVKLGGNGPIMANALAAFGMPITYVGSLGAPAVHPVFKAFAERTALHSIADPGLTDAIEFEDGKLMCGKHETLREVTWKNITAAVGQDRLLTMFSDASLVSLVNWTMLPAMTDIFKKILTSIAPRLTGLRRWMFFDLADPAKRTREDIAEVLGVIAKFEKYFNVVLGLNFRESVQIAKVLGLKAPIEKPEALPAGAKAIREALALHTVVIHPTNFAAAADETGHTAVVGPFTPKPLITTGGGDHFNAGFCLGRLLGADLALSLQLAVATSGFYVRNAKSPTLVNLKRFLRAL